MELEITPEPERREREAIEVAVDELLEDDFSAPGAAPYRSAWRVAGIRENVDGDGI